ncbi:RxLR effector protein [Phytophthora megakarya]|uniref:RxLR effector protein n=1 Tax=Phytophthora megakarya TaxID=4795 RepID=A0A225V836_9STRA|nr:RxLR effector protein [Phytophthora megakarya]
MRLDFILLIIATTLLVNSEARSLRQSPASKSVGTTTEDPADEERVQRVRTVFADPVLAAQAAAARLNKVEIPVSKLEKAKKFLAKRLLPKANDNLRLEYVGNGQFRGHRIVK